jgi:hypothetical protein
MIDNSTLPINQLIAKLNAAAEKSEPLELSVDEVKLAAKEFGDLVMIPVFEMNNIPKRYLGRDSSDSAD